MKDRSRNHLCKCGIEFDDMCNCVNPLYVTFKLNSQPYFKLCDKWKCRCSEKDDDSNYEIELIGKCANTIEKLHYILSISDRAKLRHGFRYIKELLLQHHNYFIYKSY